MIESVCFPSFDKVFEKELALCVNKRELTCCVKVIWLICDSKLHFPKLRVLKQLGHCQCFVNWSKYVLEPSRLPLLQIIKTNDGMPVMINRMNYDPYNGMSVFYLLAKNKQQLCCLTVFFLCLRRVTTLDKNVIKLICSFVREEEDDYDWSYLHALALEENLNYFAKEARALNETKKFVTFDVKRNRGELSSSTFNSDKFLLKLDGELCRIRVEMHYLESAIRRLKK